MLLYTLTPLQYRAKHFSFYCTTFSYSLSLVTFQMKIKNIQFLNLHENIQGDKLIRYITIELGDFVIFQMSVSCKQFHQREISPPNFSNILI